RRYHAFNDDHVLVGGSLLIEADDLLQQFIQLAVSEHAFDMAERQGLGRVQTVGACDQFAGTLRAEVTGMRLGDRLEESDLETAALQGADQPQADGGETDTETGGGDEEGMHELTSVEQGQGIE